MNLKKLKMNPTLLNMREIKVRIGPKIQQKTLIRQESQAKQKEQRRGKY